MSVIQHTTLIADNTYTIVCPFVTVCRCRRINQLFTGFFCATQRTNILCYDLLLMATNFYLFIRFPRLSAVSFVHFGVYMFNSSRTGSNIHATMSTTCNTNHLVIIDRHRRIHWIPHMPVVQHTALIADNAYTIVCPFMAVCLLLIGIIYSRLIIFARAIRARIRMEPLVFQIRFLTVSGLMRHTRFVINQSAFSSV